MITRHRWKRRSWAASALTLIAWPACAQTLATPGTEVLPSVDVSAAPLVPASVDNPQAVPSVGKTDTPLKDLPLSVHIIPRALLDQQGDTTLQQSIYNAPGINSGGQDSLGYFDHFLIRGLNAQIYSDGYSNGDQLGGVSHSLNGVERVEIIEGPGSALLGSGPPGGAINLIHYTPSSALGYGGSVQAGSFGSVTASGYATGPTTLPGLNFRIDGTVEHANGFRNLSDHDDEIRPALQWRGGNHTVNVAIDLRQIEQTPDSYGIIYFHGSPLKDVSSNAKYSTPFADARQSYVNSTFADKWEVTDYLTINNRFSYLYRTLDVLRNGDSSSTQISGNQVIGRQLRSQQDTDNTFDYQLEPVWKFDTGPVSHALLTGFEYQHQTLSTNRRTADLPNIPNAFAPVPPETSTAGLQFLCDTRHSCDDDNLVGNYLSLYATDQIDVGGRLKLRFGIRQDWWSTSLTPNITVPGRFGTDGQPLVAGVTDARDDAPFSWNVGALYNVLQNVGVYFGVARSNLVNFSSENTQNGIGAPENATQYEVGVKTSLFNDRLTLNTALFSVSRDNVAALTTLNGLETVIFDSQRTRGGEMSLDARLTERWHLLANFTGQDAVITDNPQGIRSVGNRPQGVPAYITNLWTTYAFSIGNIAGFHVGGGLNYQAKSFSDITNVDSIPGFVILNTTVGYDNERWGASLDVRNITDQRYFIAANGAGGFVGEPLGVFFNLHAHL
ncbi:MAG TPA: TonB-dependent receptor [Rhodopila sp.]